MTFKNSQNLFVTFWLLFELFSIRSYFPVACQTTSTNFKLLKRTGPTIVFFLHLAKYVAELFPLKKFNIFSNFMRQKFTSFTHSFSILSWVGVYVTNSSTICSSIADSKSTRLLTAQIWTVCSLHQYKPLNLLVVKLNSARDTLSYKTLKHATRQKSRRFYFRWQFAQFSNAIVGTYIGVMHHLLSHKSSKVLRLSNSTAGLRAFTSDGNERCNCCHRLLFV